MSKDKPEVGDIWQSKISNTIKLYIVKTIEYRNILYFCCINGIGLSTQKSKTALTKEYKFLGKSKINYNDLFKVAGEN